MSDQNLVLDLDLELDVVLEVEVDSRKQLAGSQTRLLHLFASEVMVYVQVQVHVQVYVQVEAHVFPGCCLP